MAQDKGENNQRRLAHPLAGLTVVAPAIKAEGQIH